MRICTRGVPGCRRRHYTHGLCRPCTQRLKRRGTTAFATPEERSELGRKAGKAAVVAMKERLDEKGYLEYMRWHQQQYLTGRPDFFTQQARDQAREAEKQAQARKRVPRESQIVIN